MTKKDFELIAATIKDGIGINRANSAALATQQRIAERFATELAATNPRFDRERFLKACGQ